MGCEVKRVPLDFNWELNKPWHGYLMPDTLDETPCPDCAHGEDHSTGLTIEAYAIANTFYPHQISWTDRARADRLAWCDKLGQKEVDHLIAEGRLSTRVDGKWEQLPRAAADVNREARGSGMIHDAINRMILTQFRCDALGITYRCASCEGHASTEAYRGQREDAENWERTDPEEGEGWQLWETVSEGSPISPVFSSPEGLASWMSSPEYQWGASRGQALTFGDALRFVSAGWAPSGAYTPETGFVTGEQWVGAEK